MTEQANTVPVTATSATISQARETAAWLAGLRSEQLLTLLVVGMFSAAMLFGWYAIRHAIPAHLATVQQGYERLAEDDRESRQAAEKAYEERFKRLSDQWDAAAKRNEETNRAIQDLVRELLFQRRAGGAILPPGGGDT